MKSSFLYEIKPYALFVLGFISGNLDHPVKWVSVLCLIAASIIIAIWRFKARRGSDNGI